MTAAPAVGRTMTAGHPPSYSTLRNARAAEYQAATREGRRRAPVRCADCRGWHLTTPAPAAPQAPSAPRTRPNTPTCAAGTTPYTPGPHSPATGMRLMTDTDTNTGD